MKFKKITECIYIDCKFTDDLMRIINRAIETANTNKPNV